MRSGTQSGGVLRALFDPRSSPLQKGAAWAAWTLALAVVSALAALDPERRTVTVAYHAAAAGFLDAQPIYPAGGREHGFLYAPGFVLLFLPFHLAGDALGGVLWRLLGAATLIHGARELCRRLRPEAPSDLLAPALLVALPMTLGALRNGQSTLLLAGACWLLLMASFEGRARAVFGWTLVAVLAKPIAVVALLLAAGLRPRMIPAIALAAAAALLAPYLVAPPAYVGALNRDFATLLLGMGTQPFHVFVSDDFTAVFRAAGLPLPESAATAVRAAAALGTFAASLWFLRRETWTGVLAVVVLASAYMCLFNPRAEGNTYAMLALPVAIGLALLARDGARLGAARALAAVLVGLGLIGVEPHVMRFANHWAPPFAMGLCTGIVLWLLAARRQGRAAANAGRDPPSQPQNAPSAN